MAEKKNEKKRKHDHTKHKQGKININNLNPTIKLDDLRCYGRHSFDILTIY